MGHLMPGLAKPVIPAFLLIATLVVPVGSHGAQQPVELQGVLGEVGFDLPGLDWVRVEQPEGPQNVRRIVHRRSGQLHVLDFWVVVLDVPPLFRGLSPREHAAAVLTASEGRLASRTDARFEGFARSERRVAGVPSPTLAYRATFPSGTVVDGLSVYYYPGDFAERRRYYLLEWYDSHPPAEPARALDEFDAFLASFRVRPVGTALLSDDFEDESAGILPLPSTDESQYWRGYVEGEYAIQKVQTEVGRVYLAVPRGIYGNVSVSVEARLVTEDTGGAVAVFCGLFGPPVSEYRFSVFPWPGTFRLDRSDAGETTVLVSPRPSSAIQLGNEWNSLELKCAGTTISAFANGTLLASIEDITYAQGNVAIGVRGAAGETPEGRFDNLVVAQH